LETNAGFSAAFEGKQWNSRRIQVITTLGEPGSRNTARASQQFRLRRSLIPCDRNIFSNPPIGSSWS